MGEVGIVAFALAVWILVLLAEVSAAALLAREGVEAQQFAQLEKIRHATGLLERLVQGVRGAGHADVGPELFAQRRDQLQRFLESLPRACHAAEFPHYLAEPLVK